MSNRAFEVTVVNKTKHPIKLIGINLDHGTTYERGDETIAPGKQTLIHVEAALFRSAEGDIWYNMVLGKESLKLHIRMQFDYPGTNYIELLAEGQPKAPAVTVKGEHFSTSLKGEHVFIRATVGRYQEYHAVAVIQQS